MSEIFNVGKISYEGPKSKNPLSFKHYNADEVIAGKTMREHLRFAMSYWHTLCGDGTDMFGIGTTDKTFGEIDPMKIAEKKVDAGFELICNILLLSCIITHIDSGDFASIIEDTADDCFPLCTIGIHNYSLFWGDCNGLIFMGECFCCRLVEDQIGHVGTFRVHSSLSEFKAQKAAVHSSDLAIQLVLIQ